MANRYKCPYCGRTMGFNNPDYVAIAWECKGCDRIMPNPWLKPPIPVPEEGETIESVDQEGTVEEAHPKDKLYADKDTWLTVKDWARLYNINPDKLYEILDGYVGTLDGETGDKLDNLVPIWNVGAAIIGLDESCDMEAETREKVEKKMKEKDANPPAPDQEGSEEKWIYKYNHPADIWDIYDRSDSTCSDVSIGAFEEETDAIICIAGRRMVERVRKYKKSLVIFPHNRKSNYEEDLAKDMLDILEEVE